MSTFNAVNTSLAPESFNRSGEETTPTTPRPNTGHDIHPQPLTRLDDATTPTRANFGALASQRPLPPAEPFPPVAPVSDAADSPNKLPTRGDSQHSTRSRDSEDVDMDGSDDGGQSGSDDEEDVNADGTRSAKKKKSQRFWCTEYPPCNLSFTRSEHLARHIRCVY
jgi:C2H2 transcription facotor